MFMWSAGWKQQNEMPVSHRTDHEHVVQNQFNMHVSCCVTTYRLILQFEVKNCISLFVISGDLCRLPHILRVRDPDPSVLEQTDRHRCYSMKILKCSGANAENTLSMGTLCGTIQLTVTGIHGFCRKLTEGNKINLRGCQVTGGNAWKNNDWILSDWPYFMLIINLKSNPS